MRFNCRKQRLKTIISKESFVVLFLLILFDSCQSKQNKTYEVSIDEREPPDLVDVTANHIIFFTGGYVDDTLTATVNDSIYFKGILNTDESLGEAKGISIYSSKISKIKLKTKNIGNVTADTIYNPVFNYKWLLISKEGNTFSFVESEIAPGFK